MNEIIEIIEINGEQFEFNMEVSLDKVVLSDVDEEPENAWHKSAWCYKCEGLHKGKPIELAVIAPYYEPDWVINEDGTGYQTSDLHYEKVVYIIDGKLTEIEVHETVWESYYEDIMEDIRNNYEAD